MTEAEWLASSDPTAMLEFLKGKASDRKLRLFAVACCRRVDELATGARDGLGDAAFYLTALENEADGVSGPGEWDAAVARVLDAHFHEFQDRMESASAAFCAFLCAIDNDPPEAAQWASVNANIALSDFPRWPEPDEVRGTPEARVQAAVLRDLFGPRPSRPVTPEPMWLTPTAVGVARGIYHGRSLHDLPILADALQDAGCDDAGALEHCRGDGPHVRGCWVVDLVLGKA